MGKFENLPNAAARGIRAAEVVRQHPNGVDEHFLYGALDTDADGNPINGSLHDSAWGVDATIGKITKRERTQFIKLAVPVDSVDRVITRTTDKTGYGPNYEVIYKTRGT